MARIVFRSMLIKRAYPLEEIRRMATEAGCFGFKGHQGAGLRSPRGIGPALLRTAPGQRRILYPWLCQSCRYYRESGQARVESECCTREQLDAGDG
jgi:hypothetical protein